MSRFRVQDVLDSTGSVLVRGTADGDASGVSTDSRTLVRGDLFIALEGPNHDGNRYAPDAVKAGASALLLKQADTLDPLDTVGLPAEVDNASEMRYRGAPIGPETLVVSVSQSGETVDTLAGMNEAKERGCPQVTICNVPGSQSSRVADAVVYTRCGPEIGVASTKTYIAGITALYLLACYSAQELGVVDRERMGGFLDPLARLPKLVGEMLTHDSAIEELANQHYQHENFLFLGRGIQYPVAMEGALKLKEVSYIHAEGYPAGEMKHGPIALIDRDMPVIAICLRDSLRDKMMSNIEQVKAREGVVIALGTEGDRELEEKADHVIYVPETSPLLAPVLASIPLQAFSYHVALRRGCDVDQPRNLAKTVTVE